MVLVRWFYKSSSSCFLFRSQLGTSSLCSSSRAANGSVTHGSMGHFLADYTLVSIFLAQLLKGNALLAWTAYDVSNVRPYVRPRVPEESSGQICTNFEMYIHYIV